MPNDNPSELQDLRKENARLRALLARHGIPHEPSPPAPSQATQATLSPAEKVALFHRLFCGRSDIYARRWESEKGTSGYAPACANEWHPSLCNKPRIKCRDCDNRQLLPLTEQVIYDHLAGQHTIGAYPLQADEHCRVLAVDFDKSEWRDDIKAFQQSCRELGIPAALEISRSGRGAHAWFFFTEPVLARDARRLGAALISHTCHRTRQLSLSSYDRLFPNQDTLPSGGFGNLIALPLQKAPRARGCSVFVDDSLEPYADQWAYLSSVTTRSHQDLEQAIQDACGGGNPLDVLPVDSDTDARPWQRTILRDAPLADPLPEHISLVHANQIFIAKADLPQGFTNRLIRIAAFQNPEFYKAQAMRLPVWNKPRIIGCAESFPQHIALPRGCFDDVAALLDNHGITMEVTDERVGGVSIEVEFKGKLRLDQDAAMRDLLAHDHGVLCAPTAFGKTVVAAGLIAQRKISTLILVHRTELMRQWQERLTTFLDVPDGGPGVVGGGKKKPTGRVDIAVIQTLAHMDDPGPFFDSYGQVIVDECHHLSAFTFESLLKQSRARHVIGLTATPERRDGHHPIIFMQCGPIRHVARRPETAPALLNVRPMILEAPAIPDGASIQEVFRVLAHDEGRNRRLVEDIVTARKEGRKILVLTERTDHLMTLATMLVERDEICFVLHGRLARKRRAEVIDALADLDPDEPRIVLASGRLVGEGFDHPPLDTLVLAMPISWKGTLQQYTGRLHREQEGKGEVRVYDYVDGGQAQLMRMWEKRQRGYRAMGYTVGGEGH